MLLILDKLALVIPAMLLARFDGVLEIAKLIDEPEFLALRCRKAPGHPRSWSTLAEFTAFALVLLRGGFAPFGHHGA